MGRNIVQEKEEAYVPNLKTIIKALPFIGFVSCVGQISPVPEFNAAVRCVEGSMSGYTERNRSVGEDVLGITYSDVADPQRNSPSVLISIRIRGRNAGDVTVEGSASTGMGMSDNSVANKLARAQSVVENVVEACSPPIQNTTPR